LLLCWTGGLINQVRPLGRNLHRDVEETSRVVTFQWFSGPIREKVICEATLVIYAIGDVCWLKSDVSELHGFSSTASVVVILCAANVELMVH
jgi:hypothetical protein